MSSALRSLQELWLSKNLLGDDGCAALARAFSVGATPLLGTMDLRENAIGDEGLVALSEPIRSGNIPLTHPLPTPHLPLNPP